MQWSHDHDLQTARRPRTDSHARPVRRLRQRPRRRRDSALPDAAGASSDARGRRRGRPRPRGRDAEVRAVHARARRRHGRPGAGGGGIRINGEGIPKEQMEAAETACQKWMDMAGPEDDGGHELTEEEKQSFLDMAACMRERGYNFPDPDLRRWRGDPEDGEGGRRRAGPRGPGVRAGPQGVRGRGRPGATRRRTTAAPSTSRTPDMSQPPVRVAVLAAGLITGSLTGCTVPGAEGAGSDDDDPATSTSTATVQRTDLTETLTESGQLEYGDPLDIGAVLTGTVTWAPAADSVVKEGERALPARLRPGAPARRHGAGLARPRPERHQRRGRGAAGAGARPTSGTPTTSTWRSTTTGPG